MLLYIPLLIALFYFFFMSGFFFLMDRGFHHLRTVFTALALGNSTMRSRLRQALVGTLRGGFRTHRLDPPAFSKVTTHSGLHCYNLVLAVSVALTWRLAMSPLRDIMSQNSEHNCLEVGRPANEVAITVKRLQARQIHSFNRSDQALSGASSILFADFIRKLIMQIRRCRKAG
ncbi:unnamed protein product [Protopolystoma xenopodis]|uniref:Uncharacterized protein n=1 Tax=Protopolystoma xenopodis TaxID=117903 RepID=A0A448WD84_9PLAT|nr:unnamed protein product [Protopolystoma xenopodis]